MRRKLTDDLIIATIKNHPNKTQAELAKLMDCAQTTVSTNIRGLVQSGKVIQTADTGGVYHYSLPEYKHTITVETPIKYVSIDDEKFINDIKASIKSDIDHRVRTYLNEQYRKIMDKLTKDLLL